MSASRARAAAASAAVLLGVLTFQPTDAEATPRMSAASGAPCATCHYSPDGGGMRTEIGFGTHIDTPAVGLDDIGVGFLEDHHTNMVADWLAVGADVRMQAARLGNPGVDDEGEGVLPERRIFPMQFEPSVALRPTDWLTMLGSYAPGSGVFDGDFCSGTYDGQMCGTAQALVTLDPQWPMFRAGLFRPHTGIQHDDHTMLVESDASRERPELLPPNYAEVGAEAGYQPVYWFRADAGVYRSDQLAAAIGDEQMVQASDPAALVRLAYHPRFDFGPEYSFYGWAGASVYGAGHLRGEGDFRMDRGFFGLGWLDRGALMLDVAHLDFSGEDGRRGFNASTTLAVELLDWLVARGRLEQATTWHRGSDDTDHRRAAVAGLQIYPIPFVKLQPEYRYTQTDDWAMGQYAMQLHLFY